MEKEPTDDTPRESARAILEKHDGEIPEHVTGASKELMEEVQEEMSNEAD